MLNGKTNLRGWFRAALCIVAAAVVVSVTAIGSVLAGEGPIRASAFKITGDGKQVLVDIQFDRDPAPSWFLLRAPYRLVIDLPRTRFAFDPETLKPKGIVAAIRYGEIDQGRSRLILTVSKPFKVGKLDVQTLTNNAAMAIELEPASRQEFDAALAERGADGSKAATAPKLVPEVVPQPAKFKVVIDPGHGGADGGAKSANGTVEKDVTLTFAKELKKKLEDTGRYEALLTRDSDIFVPLGARVEFARKHGAQLFMSIHADTIRVKSLRGATVYTVADEASDADSAALADRENLADQIGGIEIKEENQEVADILIDLIRRETHSYSINFARTLLKELADAVRLINNPHRHARFRVLRAPDVPSVLVELGYLSNTKDEEQLNDLAWRDKIAASVVEAVDAFATKNTGAGG